jgi:hypothetical protein
MKGKQKFHPLKIDFKIRNNDDFKVLKNKFEAYEQTISQMFIQAINSHDGERIMNLAKAAWFFKDKRYSKDFSPADRERMLLLHLKSHLEFTGGNASIKAVAMFLALDTRNF